MAKKGAGGGTPLVLRPDGPEILARTEASPPLVRLRVWFLTLLLGGGIVAVWVWVRTGADQPIPVEALPSPQANRSSPLPISPEVPLAVAPASPPAAPSAQEQALEKRLRGAVPPRQRNYSSDVGLKDALYQDLLNAGVRVRSVEVETLKVAEKINPEHRRPTEVNVTIEVTVSDSASIPEHLALSSLIVGSYVDRTSLSVLNLALLASIGDQVTDVPYRVSGQQAAEFFRRKIDLPHFLEGLLKAR